MANERIRKILAIEGMRQWQLAKLLGVSEFTLIRRLRDELPEIEQSRIIGLIVNERGGTDDSRNDISE